MGTRETKGCMNQEAYALHVGEASFIHVRFRSSQVIII